VTFRYKDYRRNGQARYRTMTLAADEFIRRLPAPRSAKGLPSYSPLWAAGECRLQSQYRARQQLIGVPISESIRRQRTTQPIRTPQPIIVRHARAAVAA
jgi:hypothetical protein